ncbi:MAG: hypothetical protein A3F70_12255 [Acidobacteria bacterium RIFCSPLOWO2_12_FULL_67_14]|nr:MAG: hypothetical protein A3H29_19600 [Acidobacteria bacterium RIFCSPLOWO2_02_FULL_67_21]OFW34926.1 MAG: hypothetical protein A3F70_12255 [Acidobacteria bacterium RIFCSPLOWO2_12_FULL_67_14]
MHAGARSVSRVAAVVAGVTIAAGVASGQSAAPNSQPNPYRTIQNWSKLPGRTIGQMATIDIDRQGNIWVIERCGGTSCADKPDAPAVAFNASGDLVKSIGAGIFAQPHGIGIDRDGNIWVTDTQNVPGKGQQVHKFSPDGTLLLSLGTAGVPGDGPGTFNGPSDVAVAPNGDIFVGDGHGGNTNARIVKFSRDGKFIKTWGRRGTGPGDFGTPHGLAFDSKGRLFVADRDNNRVQIFNQDGEFLAEWTQFGRPSGLHIDANDTLYVADSQSDGEKQNPPFRRGIRIGSARDGSVTAFIPFWNPDPKASAPEGVITDAAGNLYTAGNNFPVVKHVKAK